LGSEAVVQCIESVEKRVASNGALNPLVDAFEADRDLGLEKLG
jgi:hypothetical protein